MWPAVRRCAGRASATEPAPTDPSQPPARSAPGPAYPPSPQTGSGGQYSHCCHCSQSGSFQCRHVPTPVQSATDFDYGWEPSGCLSHGSARFPLLKFNLGGLGGWGIQPKPRECETEPSWRRDHSGPTGCRVC